MYIPFYGTSIVAMKEQNQFYPPILTFRIIPFCIIASRTISFSKEALEKRYNQGWVLEIETDMAKLIERIRVCRRDKIRTSIAFHGNVTHVVESLAAHFKRTNERLVDLCSDQTSCHNPFLGGYFPVQVLKFRLICVFCFFNSSLRI